MTRTALVVDDEPDIREIARLALEEVAGWRVVEASNGEDALEVAARQLPDVVLLDVMMPGLDGPSTAGRLASDPRTQHLPIILLTARVGREEVAELQSGPVAAVLAKPFDPMTLADDIAEALGW